jgi:ABC-2 type transport system permease protein
MVLPWASPLEIVKDKTRGLQVTELFKSSKYSWAQKEVFDLSPKEGYFPAPADMKEQLMGVALSGKFKSFYAGKKVPAAEEEKKAPALPQQQKEPPVIAESKETKLIVVGNSRFITENFPAEFDGNRIFFQNVIDWVTVGDALIGIRSRESTDRPLMVVSEQAKAAIRFINILGVAILAGLFGLGRFYLRRRRKKNGIQEI